MAARAACTLLRGWPTAAGPLARVSGCLLASPAPALALSLRLASTSATHAGGSSSGSGSGSSDGKAAHGGGSGGTASSRSSGNAGHSSSNSGGANASARRAKRKGADRPAAKASSSTSSPSPPSSAGAAGAAARARAKAKKGRKGNRRRHRTAKAPSAAAATGPSAAALARRRSKAAATGSTGAAGGRVPKRKRLLRGNSKRTRVCVLSSSYEGTDSATAAVDDFLCTPEHYVKKDRGKYTFDDVSVRKNDSYRTIRELVTSKKYDVFFNLCDGGRDEKRAGVDVVEALEEMNAAFTGTDSRSFEPSKIDMKLLVGSSGIKVPNFVHLNDAESLAKKCRHLRFPVIVKHLSGYASVGINKDNRCNNLDELKKKVPAFIKEYNHALVEEFIRGREGTVLACADTHSPHGVKVFKPLMFNFLKDGDDFAYFEKKWGMECTSSSYGFLPHTDPAYAAITDMARNAYKYIMNTVGYGRVDFRIDDRTNEPYFLEINPNCGMWYSEKDGGDFADIMVQGDAHWNHERFLATAVTRALREQDARKPWYFISHDKTGQFTTRASRTVPAGKCLFGDAVHPIPVVSKALYKLGADEPTVGCVICRGDGIHHAVAIRHSCTPNMQFVHGRTLLFAAKRQINVGEELSVDYATLRDEHMPTFACSCGTEKCRSVIFAMPATARTVEMKAARKILREKKRLWLKERIADKAAERILKKRSAATAAAAAATSTSASSASAASSSSSSSSTSTGSGASSSGGANGASAGAGK